MDIFIEWLTGSFSKWLILSLMVGGSGVYAYLKWGRKPKEKKQGNTELIFIEVKSINKTLGMFNDRLGIIEENSLLTRKEVTQIRSGCLQREKACNSKFDTLFDKFNNMPVVAPQKNGKAKQTGSVLVVDDEYCITSMIKQHLEAKGYTVRTANNYREAKTAIEENYYNWAIIDVVLKRGDSAGNNGYRLWETLHKQRKDQTKKILMSGYSPEDVPIPTYLQKHLREDMVFIGKENLCDTLDKKMV